MRSVGVAGGLAEGVADSALPTGTRQGMNDWKRTGYGGPCPPIGRHRYFHKLYALDTELGDLGRPDKAALEAAMRGHVLFDGRNVLGLRKAEAAGFAYLGIGRVATQHRRRRSDS